MSDGLSSFASDLALFQAFRVTFGFFSHNFAACSKPPSRDNHRKASYPRTNNVPTVFSVSTVYMFPYLVKSIFLFLYMFSTLPKFYFLYFKHCFYFYTCFLVLNKYFCTEEFVKISSIYQLYIYSFFTLINRQFLLTG